nr:discoidin domain-containing protein [uncultured Draconibacterium sp.]
MMKKKALIFICISVIAFWGVNFFQIQSEQQEEGIEKIENEGEESNEERPEVILSEQEKSVNKARIERYFSSPALKSASGVSSYANGIIEGSWEQMRFLSEGKTGYGFRVDGSVYDQEHDVIYAISYAGHIWKINREGDDYTKTSWELMNHKGNFLESYIDGLNKSDGSFRMVRSSGNGMQYSDDEGRTWSAAGGVTAAGESFEGAVVKKAGANRIFTLVKTSSNNLQTYISINDGTSYSALSINFNSSAYNVKMFKAANTESVFIAALSNSDSKLRIYECAPADSDFKLIHTSTTTFVGMNRIFGTYYNDKYHFYVAAQNTHIYYSADKGNSWQLKNSSNNSNGDTNPRTVHATKPNVIFQGYLDVNMSVNYGMSFSNFSHLLGWDVHHMKMYQKKDGSYFHFVGKDFGCYISDEPESSNTYLQLNNSAPTQMCYDADHAQNYYSSFTSTQDRGTVGFETYTNESYTTDVKTTDGLRVTLGNKEESVWTWMYYGSIFRQANFAVRSSGLAQINYTGNWWAAPMVTSPDKKEDAVYIAAGPRLTKLTYNPANNSIVQTNHYYDFGSKSGSEITGFGYSPLNSNRWYVSVKTGNFYYSLDGGQTFKESSYNGVFPRANDQGYNYHKNQHVIKGSNIDEKRVYYAGVGNLFMISDDGGETFTNHSNGLNVYRIRDFDYTPDEKFIFAACAYGGIWVYSVDDDQWFEMNDEAVPYVSFNDVEFIVRENTVNFATYGSGILKFKLEGMNPIVAYPDSLVASIDENSNVELNWKDNSNNEIAFIIQRSKAGGAFAQIGNVSAGQTSFTDNQITEADNYIYRVKAINANQSSAFSNYAAVTTEPEGTVSKENWTLVSVNSEVPNGYSATNAFDNIKSTMWHTDWNATPKPSHPHTLVIDLAKTYNLKGFSYLPRQDNNLNGTIKDYAFYVSTDNSTWTKAAEGTWAANFEEKVVEFSSAHNARYIKLIALSEVNGAVFASCAELSAFTQFIGLNVPETPQFVQGGRLSDLEVELIWLDVSNNEDGFVVQQLVDGAFQTIYTSGQNATSYKLQNTNTKDEYTFRLAAFNSDGTSEYSRLLTLYGSDTPVGIEDRMLAEKEITVYPNPFSNEIMIKTDGESSFSEWKIYDLSGRILKSGTFSNYSNLERINTSELNSGNYLLQLHGKQGVVSKTIIKNQ